MKIKRIAEDFRVEELTEFAPADAGEFALYRLTKRGLGTPEAIEAIVRRWKLDRGRIAYGGLKDRHAVTTQYVTVYHGPRRSLRQTNLELDYIGAADRPFASSDITANRFHVVIRALTGSESAAAEHALAEAARDGLPDYFDDQRFGSLGESNEFVARHWIAGDYQRALWLAVADANPLDRPRDRQEKQWIRQHWGSWPSGELPLQGPRRNIVQHLRNHPADFRGALARIPPNLRTLYVAAFQSYLWNRLLAEFLVMNCPPDQLVPVRLKVGEVPFFLSLTDSNRALLQATALPLPSARVHLEQGPVKDLVDRSLGSLGLTLRELRIKYPRDSFFSKGWRSAVIMVSGVQSETGSDELYRGQCKLSLQFDLARGSYATILIKRITQAAGIVPDQAELEDRQGSDDEEAETAGDDDSGSL